MAPSVTDAARSIIATMREQFGAPQTMVLADASAFPHLDLQAYAGFQAEMETAGYHAIGDIEILELSNSPTTTIARTFIRTMLSADGSTVFEYYQVKPRIWRKLKMLFRGVRNLRLYDAPMNFFNGLVTRHCGGFESEFGDGTQLMTSNAQSAAIISGPNSIEYKYFPYGTPISVLLKQHLARISEIAAGHPPERPLTMRSMDDILEMQKRQHMQKVAHRASVDWVTLGELRGMSGGQDELGETIFAEVRRLLRAEQGGR